MRIACLQFAPQVGDVDHNLNRADAILSRANPRDLDLLVLPELAFSGYNFRSLQHISPYLEPTTAGITSLWARTAALKYNCKVTAGYPEKVDVTEKWPAGPEYYNSAVTVNQDGETILNYRKSFLYYTDETWALEGPAGFFGGQVEGLGNVAMGICMDLNPYKFEAPWFAWEFAKHALRVNANLVVLSMAWLTREDARSFSRSPQEPDMETLSYWLARLEPLIRAETEEEIIVVFANRCGIEGDAVYAGTSAVLGIQDGEVRVYGILGRGEKELLIIDTDQYPQAKLISEKTSSVSTTTATAQPVVTPSTATIPETDEGVNILEDAYNTFSPVSPTDPKLPQAYFGPKSPCGVENRRNSLVSSTQDLKAFPISESSASDESGTSEFRDGGRSAQQEEHAAGVGNPLTESLSQSATNLFAVKLPPQSVSAAPDSNQSSFTRNPLGPRSRHISPRPTSTMW